MLEFDLVDYSALMTKVHTADPLSDNFLEKFPELRLYKEFSVDLGEHYNINQVIAYTVFCYDPNSPHVKKYKSLPERKFHALQDAQFKLNKDKTFGRHVEFMVDGNVPEVNDIIVQYVKTANNTTYSLLITLEAMFYSHLKNSLSGDIRDTKATELEKVKVMLQNAQRDLLAEETNKNVVQTLYKHINKSQVDYSPEAVAEKIKAKGHAKALEEDDDE